MDKSTRNDLLAVSAGCFAVVLVGLMGIAALLAIALWLLTEFGVL